MGAQNIPFKELIRKILSRKELLSTAVCDGQSRFLAYIKLKISLSVM